MLRIEIINPALEKNRFIVAALAKAHLGNQPGRLNSNKVYALLLPCGNKMHYCLTLSVSQFVRNSEAAPTIPEIRLNILDKRGDAYGKFGCVITVIESIIFINNLPVFDREQSYVVKKLAIKSARTDKEGKPNWDERSAKREHYFGGGHLGTHYQLLKQDNCLFIHMNRVPGTTLSDYIGKLTEVQFLSLACTLLQTFTDQVQRLLPDGKHAGEIIVHCDLKPENIMAKWRPDLQTWEVNYIDFGLSKAKPRDLPYATFFCRGNMMVFDKHMAQAKINNQPIIYSEDSDLYALFVVISQLAGVTRRTTLNTLEALVQDLDAPDLTGLFQNMTFDEQMKNNLIDVIQRMLTANKDQRLSREEALLVFSTNLLKLEKVTSTTQPVIQTAPPANASTLKACVEENLKDDKSPLDLESLQSWVKKYRSILSSISNDELECFNCMLSRHEIIITSPYIQDLRRFDLLQYTDISCSVILLRHHEMIRFLNPGNETSAWDQRFLELKTKLPLQLHNEDQLFLNQVSLLKTNVSKLKRNKSQSAPEVYLNYQLQTQLDIDFVVWCADLHNFLPVFNLKCNSLFAMQTIWEIFQRLNPVYQRHLVPWLNKMAEYILSNDFNLNQDYIDKRVKLAHLLFDFQGQATIFNQLCHRFPRIVQAPLLLEIQGLIQTFDMRNDESIDNLNLLMNCLAQLLSAYIELHQSDLYVHNSFIKMHPIAWERCINYFHEVIQYCTETKKFLPPLQTLISYMQALKSIAYFVDRMALKNSRGQYLEIIRIMGILMGEYDQCLVLNSLTDQEMDWKYLPFLNKSLQGLCSSSTAVPNSTYLKEFARFWACPVRFRPFEPIDKSEYSLPPPITMTCLG